MSLKRSLHIILIVILIADLGYSFFQHFHMPMDGDMASIIVPAEAYQQVLHDPFGLGVLKEGKTYAATNRFFAHWTMASYYKTVPQALQLFSGPLDSVYLSSALAKTGMQLFLILLLAAMMGKPTSRARRGPDAANTTGSTSGGTTSRVENQAENRDENRAENTAIGGFILAAVLITPLFQTSGYNASMGIIDDSVTYAFFYALPMVLLLTYLLPYFRHFYSGQEWKMRWPQMVLFLILAVILAFSGPLVPAVVLIVCPFAIFMEWRKHYRQLSGHPLLPEIFHAAKKIPAQFLFFFSFITVLCAYSLYLGTYNSESLSQEIPLLERYSRLMTGLYLQLTEKLGVPLLLLMIIINTWIIIKKGPGQERDKLLNILKWTLLFCLAYLVLLPLGGYRVYRPNIIRGDTMIPVTLALMYFYGMSTLYLLKTNGSRFRKAYLAGLIIFLVVYTFADQPDSGHYHCERTALEEISRSPEHIVLIESDCTIMAWKKITDYRSSSLNAKLLRDWGVSDTEKLYYQE